MTLKVNTETGVVTNSKGEDRTKLYNSMKDGDKGEAAYAAFLASKGCTEINHPQGYFPGYDFEYKTSQGARKTVEVKYDNKATPNLPFEFTSWGKPSGIAATQAEFIAIHNPNDKLFYVASVPKLREYIESNKHRLRVVKNTLEPESNTYMYLIPKSEFVKYFQTYNAAPFQA